MSMVVYTNVNVSVILGVPCVLSSFLGWYIGKRCPHEKRFSSNTGGGGEEEGQNWPVVE